MKKKKECYYCGAIAEVIFEVNKFERFDSCQPCVNRIMRATDEAYTKALGSNWRELI